jgi:thymidylate synthase ThyX
MTCSVKVIEATTYKGKAIYTFQLKYWRAIHGELMTHRMFSRNASSSRAIPVMKTISQVWNDPAMPVHWGVNQAGMQAKEQLTGFKLKLVRGLWRLAAKVSCGFAYTLVKLNLHKQVANRILEPWQYIHVVLTATEFDNFFELRDHPDAQPEFQELARAMKIEMSECFVREVSGSGVPYRFWHLPYVKVAERQSYSLDDCIKFSAARCARVSYATHDGKAPKPEQDFQLYDRLVGSVPRHSSPVEHQAEASIDSNVKSKNFVGWIQFRELLEKHNANKPN